MRGTRWSPLAPPTPRLSGLDCGGGKWPLRGNSRRKARSSIFDQIADKNLAAMISRAFRFHPRSWQLWRPRMCVACRNISAALEALARAPARVTTDGQSLALAGYCRSRRYGSLANLALTRLLKLNTPLGVFLSHGHGASADGLAAVALGHLEMWGRTEADPGVAVGLRRAVALKLVHSVAFQVARPIVTNPPVAVRSLIIG